MSQPRPYNNEVLMDVSLKVFIGLMMYVRPLLSWGIRGSEIERVENDNPAIVALGSWQDVKLMFWGLFGLYAIFSFSAGYRLKHTHTVSSVKFALITLWVTGPVFTTLEAIVSSHFLASGGGFFTPQFYGSLFASIFWAIAFSSYLLRSSVVEKVYQLPPGWPFNSKAAVTFHSPHIETETSSALSKGQSNTSPSSRLKRLVVLVAFTGFIVFGLLSGYTKYKADSAQRAVEVYHELLNTAYIACEKNSESLYCGSIESSRREFASAIASRDKLSSDAWVFFLISIVIPLICTALWLGWRWIFSGARDPVKH